MCFAIKQAPEAIIQVSLNLKHNRETQDQAKLANRRIRAKYQVFIGLGFFRVFFFFFYFDEEKFYFIIQSLHYLQCNTYTTYSTILTLLTIRYLHYLQYDTYTTCNTVLSLLQLNAFFFIFFKVVLNPFPRFF